MYTPDSDPQSNVFYVDALWTTCAGTWLAQPADVAERERIDRAVQAVKEQRKLAMEFYADPRAAKQFALELFQRPEFAPLHLSDELVQMMIERAGEPPVVTDADDPAFAHYLNRAVLSIANSKVRRHLANQLRRLLPQFVAAQQWREAIAIDTNAFRTALGNEASPFLVQMAFSGLVRYYEAMPANTDTPAS